MKEFIHVHSIIRDFFKIVYPEYPRWDINHVQMILSMGY